MSGDEFDIAEHRLRLDSLKLAWRAENITSNWDYTYCYNWSLPQPQYVMNLSLTPLFEYSPDTITITKSSHYILENFYNNRYEFKQLAEMLLEDSHVRHISENLVLTCGSPEMEKFNRYQELINQTALFGLRSNFGPSQQITFLRQDGYANAKFVKGYVYTNSVPQDMVASLDDNYRNLPPGSRLYKKIEKNWYIYLEHQSDG